MRGSHLSQTWAAHSTYEEAFSVPKSSCSCSAMQLIEPTRQPRIETISSPTRGKVIHASVVPAVEGVFGLNYVRFILAAAAGT
jgi:hypothetical protein